MILSWCWKGCFCKCRERYEVPKAWQKQVTSIKPGKGPKTWCRYICWSSPSSPRWVRQSKKWNFHGLFANFSFLSCNCNEPCLTEALMLWNDWKHISVPSGASWNEVSRRPETPPQEVQNALQSANEWSPPPPPAKSNQYKAYRPTGPTVFAFIVGKSLDSLKFSTSS